LPASQRLQQLAIQHLPALLMANTCRQEYENLPNPSTLLRDEPKKNRSRDRFFFVRSGACPR
ncbi:hypothetical protein, partial [Bordetella parapertussis]|uniref:hypothetical protein n=1 Tax=Bordetella parapertussis TaxID=519 RepID=UPI001C702C4E